MTTPGSSDSPPASRSRRWFLGLGAVFTGLLAACRSSDPGETPSLLGRPVSPYGSRSRFETSVRDPRASRAPESASSRTPLQDSVGIITPAALHYERHHGGVPDIDPDGHRLMIHGLVQRPLVLTLDDLRRLPSVSRIHFLECSGNGSSEWRQPTGRDAQQIHGLTSCSEWTGVSLRMLLDECGIRPEASWIVAEGADACKMTRSVPLSKVRDDVLVAYGQNGEALRPEQGYPLRLLVPGWEGNISVKWLRRVKVVDQPYMTREETSKYTDLMPDGTARQFTFMMEPKSLITRPSPGHHLDGPGFHEISGLAWSGQGVIERVEISTDGGASWQDAELQAPVLPIAHTRFRLDWTWDGRERILQSRCTDEAGYCQQPREALVAVRGFNSNYHNNAIQSWRLRTDGTLENAHA
jgi:sulfane dehydrogenase subunit SoxC